jgi:uncharacterized protein
VTTAPRTTEDVEDLLKRDPEAAVCYLRAAAERGEPQAQLLLGELLINGVGAPRNPKEALRQFRAAAHSLVPMAMNMVGRCYEYGLGVSTDLEEAATWYHKAAMYDCDWAIYNYAHMLAHGRGVPKDRGAAFLWFKLAATRGHARAMHFLGQYYENGWETAPDRQAALSWYRRSAEGGDFRGQCSHASVLAEEGRVEEALEWLRLAARTATPTYLTHLAATLEKSTHSELRDFSQTLREGLRRPSERPDLSASYMGTAHRSAAHPTLAEPPEDYVQHSDRLPTRSG